LRAFSGVAAASAHGRRERHPTEQKALELPRFGTKCHARAFGMLSFEGAYSKKALEMLF
jgi:hypothetical protein